jgi:hypothetical protein
MFDNIFSLVGGILLLPFKLVGGLFGFLSESVSAPINHMCAHEVANYLKDKYKD